MKKTWRIVLSVLLVLLTVSAFTGCRKEAPAKGAAVEEDLKIYWNVERDQYVAKGMNGVSARFPRDDGRYYIRFAIDGDQIDLAVFQLLLAGWLTEVCGRTAYVCNVALP